jgi:hypothetical protein
MVKVNRPRDGPVGGVTAYSSGQNEYQPIVTSVWWSVFSCWSVVVNISYLLVTDAKLQIDLAFAWSFSVRGVTCKHFYMFSSLKWVIRINDTSFRVCRRSAAVSVGLHHSTADSFTAVLCNVKRRRSLFFHFLGVNSTNLNLYYQVSWIWDNHGLNWLSKRWYFNIWCY